MIEGDFPPKNMALIVSPITNTKRPFPYHVQLDEKSKKAFRSSEKPLLATTRQERKKAFRAQRKAFSAFGVSKITSLAATARGPSLQARLIPNPCPIQRLAPVSGHFKAMGAKLARDMHEFCP
ncbi:MAG: hypothetical protein LBT59_29640 [Clostridiales bacterium]|nr:hypothetical protein [Clostridiales bacterium]